MDGLFLNDLRGFGITADHWTTAAQGEGGLHRTAEQGAERFMAKLVAAEKARVDYGMQYIVVVCPNVTRRANKRVAQSKRARAGLLAIVD